MFRRERPQKGRMRQFHQIGAEALGRGDPFIDTEVLLMLGDFFRAVGLETVALELNSLGCADCRPGYRQRLLEFLKTREAALCDNCRRRMERNPLRVLDCKEPGCRHETKTAPSILDFLCAPCQEHFAVVKLLSEAKVAYELNPRMVRGLDYYCRTTFEWTSDRLGSQSAVAAGGHMTAWWKSWGAVYSGVGFAMGVERLAMLLRRTIPPRLAGRLFTSFGSGRMRGTGLSLVHRLRREGSWWNGRETRSMKARCGAPTSSAPRRC
jgi:histidyl-tRNA synthetase